MMYHRSIGTRYTAKKSTLARAYRSRLAPTTLHVYDPFLLNVVDFTCTRKNLPWSSTPTSYAAESPCGRDTFNPRSAARAIKHNSAHSPRSLQVFFDPMSFRTPAPCNSKCTPTKKAARRPRKSLYLFV